MTQRKQLSASLQFVQDLELNRLDAVSITSALKHFGCGALKDHDKNNTLLLEAIAWNYLTAAELLLDQDDNHLAVNIADTWPSGKNTPLLLAAKTHANKIVSKLLNKQADVNAQDYAGNTALHYACLYRNNELIEQLLDAGTNLYAVNHLGHTPYTYYQLPLQLHDLSYRYGFFNGELKVCSDRNPSYCATKHPAWSNLRWFIPHITINMPYNPHDKNSFNPAGYSLLQNKCRQQLAACQPIRDESLYKSLLQYFVQQRPVIEKKLAARLEPRLQLQESVACRLL